jgi:hypothetical protein
MEKYLTFDEQLCIRDDEIKRLQAEVDNEREEKLAQKTLHLREQQRRMECAVEIASLRGQVDRLVQDNAELRGRISMLELVERGLTEQNQQLMDPIVRAKMLEPPPPIHVMVTDTNRINELERLLASREAEVNDSRKSFNVFSDWAAQELEARPAKPTPVIDELVSHYCNILDNLGDVPIPNFEQWAEDQWKRGNELLVNIASPSTEGCVCHRCIEEKDIRSDGMPLSHTMIISCPVCGNKRCPKASDHRNACTNSNEPGQAGSIYGGME